MTTTLPKTGSRLSGWIKLWVAVSGSSLLVLLGSVAYDHAKFQLKPCLRAASFERVIVDIPPKPQSPLFSLWLFGSFEDLGRPRALPNPARPPAPQPPPGRTATHSRP